jgi:hypothetical protein
MRVLMSIAGRDGPLWDMIEVRLENYSLAHLRKISASMKS